MDLNEATDAELMLRAQGANDVAAFGELARRWRPVLVRFFAATLPLPGHADDAAQETLLRLWLLRARYRPTGRFSAYVLTVARHFGLNQAVKFRAQAPREQSLDTAAPFLAAPAPTTQPERIALARHEADRVRAAVAALPPGERAVFLLSHDDGLRYAEIAARLHIPVGTVKSRMASAVRRLRAALTNEEKENR